eukprot:9857169-Lingulodinium_polyedra.AAC.1
MVWKSCVRLPVLKRVSMVAAAGPRAVAQRSLAVVASCTIGLGTCVGFSHARCRLSCGEG